MESVKRYSVAGKSALHETTDGEWIYGEDFDRVSAENLALQQRLTVQDQRVDELETERNKYRDATLRSCHLVAVRTVLLRSALEYVNDDDLADEIRAALKPTAEAESHE
ncbi:hypothetical protein M1D68_16155 [Pseudomonas sp. R4-84]